MKDTLTVCSWNSRGLKSSIPYIRELFTRFDIVLISEHMLTTFNEISPDANYIARASKHSNADLYGIKRGQGGVSIIWRKNCVNITPMQDCVHDRCCGIRVQNEHNAILNIFSVYLPAKGCEGDLKTTIDEISGILETTEVGANNIVSGDFNGDMGTKGGPRGIGKCSKEGNIVYRFMTSQNLFAANLSGKSCGPIHTFNGPNGGSCIDYAMIPKDLDESLIECEVLDNEPLNTSDHNPVVITLKFSGIESNTLSVKRQGGLKWNKITPEKLLNNFTLPVEKEVNELLLYLCDKAPTTELIDEAFNSVVDILKDAERAIPKAKYSPHIKPYWCPELSDLKRKKVQCFKAWVQAGRPRDRENVFRAAHCDAKKNFIKRLHAIAKTYEDNAISEAVCAAEVNRNTIWKMLRSKKESANKVVVIAIKNKEGKVMHSTDDILGVWKTHFSELCTARSLPIYDQQHYEFVNNSVEEWYNMDDADNFLLTRFTKDEIRKAINKLNSGKSPGFDSITKEHIKAAGQCMIDFMYFILTWIVTLEYIPKNFRTGIQVPLYKGKNASILDPNNYRGITLLSTFNKIFEILVWARIEGWWHENNVVLEAQGACRKGVSSLHSAMMLQETISENLGESGKVFVAYLDVSKAFDRVWIQGLFYQLYQAGLKGKIWRLLYSCYKEFYCKVKINDRFSDWYKMTCGIHQGGFLSLVKYTAFINSLLVILNNSDLCCKIARIPSTPLGYADDMAAATTSKHKIDRVLSIVHVHSCKWRYDLNAKKSAVMVYGESINENKQNSIYRMYRLGKESVPEKTSYDHVGIKTCNGKNYIDRTLEKISKSRKALSASSALGIKHGGISMKACNILYWSLISPILTYGAEIWILKANDIEALDKYQRYAGRRIQRFPTFCPNETSFKGLGWIRTENFIYAKKLIFIRTILIRNNDCIFKRIVKVRSVQFNNNMMAGMENEHDSPVFDILRVSVIFNMYDIIMNMVHHDHIYNKVQWRKMVWQRAWEVEDNDWQFSVIFHNTMSLLNMTNSGARYLTWWHVADAFPAYIKNCEIMSKLVCRTSRLKSDDYRYKGSSFYSKSCSLCNLVGYENVEHMVMSCPYNQDLRTYMFNELNTSVESRLIWRQINAHETLKIILGGKKEDIDFEDMIPIWCITCVWVTRMYIRTINDRTGVG